MQLFPALPEVVRGRFRRPEALAVCPPGGDSRERGMFWNQTTNYGLTQWEATDRILMENFNSDNSKIDAALGTLAQTVTGHTTALTQKGNCQLYMDSYTGTGTYGTSNPTQLTFPGYPVLVFVFAATNGQIIAAHNCNVALQAYNGNSSNIAVNWTNHTVSWSHFQSANQQFNASGVTYSVVALLDMER